MINEQVFIWIQKNSHIYMRNWYGNEIKEEKIVEKLRDIDKIVKKIAWKMLRNK